MLYLYNLPYELPEIDAVMSLHAKKCDLQNLTTSNCYLYRLRRHRLTLF